MATPSTQQQLQQQQDYFRSVSNESTTYMMVPAAGQRDRERREAPSKMWVAMVVIVVVVLQIASTTGLFVYLNMSISQVRSEGVTEELKCLSLLNALDKNEDIPEQLAQLFGEPCIKLAEGIKAYISKVRQDRTRLGGIDGRRYGLTNWPVDGSSVGLRSVRATYEGSTVSFSSEDYPRNETGTFSK
ncbi:TNF superfamily member 10, like [Gadus macrocephalus]|uniref:TNF superfamily member 10, like n=1 Tax=Gadus macrocephalus TaxID=80720 RepID=UPI0028CBAB7C|nr:TNF superfamily member 10, like [Gadus macrocephalus]